MKISRGEERFVYTLLLAALVFLEIIYSLFSDTSALFVGAVLKLAFKSLNLRVLNLYILSLKAHKISFVLKFLFLVILPYLCSKELLELCDHYIMHQWLAIILWLFF